MKERGAIRGILLFFLIGIVSAIPYILIVDPTPEDASTITDNFTFVNTTITYPSGSADNSAWIDWESSLVGYFGMDYYGSSNIYDNSSNSAHASFNGDAFGANNITTGIRGNALEFDGINDYLTANDNLFDFGTNDFTISYWINPYNITNTLPMFLFCKHYGDGDNGFSIGEGTNGLLRVWVNTSGGGLSVNDFYTLGWQHVVVTFTQTTGNITAYKNGVYNSSATTSPWNVNTAYPLTIGRRADSPLFYFNGSLDEILIFNRTLSSQEVLALYDSSANRLYNNFTNLVEGSYGYSVFAINGSGELSTSSRSVIVNYSYVDSPGQELENTTPEENGGGYISPLYTVKKENLQEGQARYLREQNRVKLEFSNQSTQTLEVLEININGNFVKIKINDEIIIIDLGSLKKIDANADGFYDLILSVEEITSSGSGKLVFKETHEEITSETQEEVEEEQKEENSPQMELDDVIEKESKFLSYWKFYVLGVIVLLIILTYFLFKKKTSNTNIENTNIENTNTTF